MAYIWNSKHISCSRFFGHVERVQQSETAVSSCHCHFPFFVLVAAWSFTLQQWKTRRHWTSSALVFSFLSVAPLCWALWCVCGSGTQGRLRWSQRQQTSKGTRCNYWPLSSKQISCASVSCLCCTGRCGEALLCGRYVEKIVNPFTASSL